MEIKDVTSWLGIEATTLDEFKEKFAKVYSTEEQFFKDEDKQSKIIGKTLGSIKTNINRLARANGIEIPKSELEGMKVEDVANLMFTKQIENYTSQIEELKASAGQGSDEKIKEWESKYDKLNSKVKDTESLLKQKEAEFLNKETEYGNQIKGVKLSYVKEQLWNSATFAPGTDALKIKGFKADFNERYNIDLDETGNPFIASADGKRIPNPAKHSEFLAPQDLLNMELDKAGLTPKNQQSGRPAFQAPAGNPTVTPQTPQGTPLRKLSPRATNI